MPSNTRNKNGLQEWLLSGSQPDTRRGERSATLDVEEQEVIRRRMRTDKWTLDRGAGYYATEREKKKLPCLVQTGRHAGRSRVRYVGVDSKTFWSHILRRDFFTTAVNAKLVSIVSLLVVWYFTMLLGWSTIYYVIWRWNNSCFIGFHGFRSAFMYATETQQTIGYGERATGECWAAAVLVSIHSLQAVLLDSVILGIIFSRISHPKQRSRTVLISDCACIARRDGQLKLMFRVADIQMRSVIDPRVRAVMYSFGPGRRTAEGEKIPVTAQEMVVTLDRTLLLPATVEHTVDEASPLFGHTLQSLEAVGAEIVVTFEASSELGDTFMARQSYLPSEIHWGHTFVNIIRPARQGETLHEVDLSRFHDVEPQPGLGDELTQPHRLSKKVVAGGGSSSVVPGRLLAENTLVLSEDAVVASRNGRAYLMFRLGDSFPGHVIDVQVTAYLYRWHSTHTAEGELLPYEEQPLALEPTNLLLRYPVTLAHELDPASSPIAHWATKKGMSQDADAEVVLVARGTLYSRQEVITRTRVYSVLGDIKWGHAFLPVVLPGSTAAGGSSKLGAAVDWSHFHATSPITMPAAASALQPSPAAMSPRHTTTGGYSEAAPSTSGSAFTAAAGSAAAAGLAAPAAARMGPPPQLEFAGPAVSRLARPQAVSPMLRSPELSNSASSLASLHQAAQQQQQQQQLVPPPQAVPAPDPTLPHPSQYGGAQPPPTQGPPPQPRPQPPQLPRPPSFQQQLSRPPALLQRSPSALLLVPGGGGDLGQTRPASATAFAAPGAVSFSRRTDDDWTTGGNSDDLSSPGNTTTFSSGGFFAQPPAPGLAGAAAGGTGPPTAGTGGAAGRQQSGTGFAAGSTMGAERRDSERTWHQTRSLFAALESIQQHLHEEQEQQQQQQQQQHHHHHQHQQHQHEEYRHHDRHSRGAEALEAVESEAQAQAQAQAGSQGGLQSRQGSDTTA